MRVKLRLSGPVLTVLVAWTGVCYLASVACAATPAYRVIYLYSLPGRTAFSSPGAAAGGQVVGSDFVGAIVKCRG